MPFKNNAGSFRDKGRALLLAVAVLVIGCSKGTLDRKSASEKINEAFSEECVHIPVRIGRLGLHCETRTAENGKTADLELDPKTDTAVTMAHAADYVDVVPDGEGSWKVNLTNTGRTFVAAYHIVPEPPPSSSHCGYQFYSLPLATAHVVEVTGIVPGEKTAQVEFTWNWTLTDLGRGLRGDGKIYSALNDVHRDSLKMWLSANPGPTLKIPAPSDEELKAPHHDTAQFVKYDDGWRLKK
jgi:hypothetical protein